MQTQRHLVSPGVLSPFYSNGGKIKTLTLGVVRISRHYIQEYKMLNITPWTKTLVYFPPWLHDHSHCLRLRFEIVFPTQSDASDRYPSNPLPAYLSCRRYPNVGQGREEGAHRFDGSVEPTHHVMLKRLYWRKCNLLPCLKLAACLLYENQKTYLYPSALEAKVGR